MDFRIIDGSEELNSKDVARLLKMAYWAKNRSIDVIEKSMRNSSCYGIYLDSEKNS